KRFRRGVGLYRFGQPDRALSQWRSEMIELRGLDKPQIRLRAARSDDAPLGLARVEELVLGRVITTKDHPVLPVTEVADHLQVGAAGRDPGRTRGAETAWESPKRAVHRHQQIVFADVANARPFGVPAVSAVVAMTR